MEHRFAKFASIVARAAGSPVTFILCVAVVVIWAIFGPVFDFSENWQLVINTGTDGSVHGASSFGHRLDGQQG